MPESSRDGRVRAVADDLFRIMRDLVYAMVELQLVTERDDAACEEPENDAASSGRAGLRLVDNEENPDE